MRHVWLEHGGQPATEERIWPCEKAIKRMVVMGRKRAWSPLRSSCTLWAVSSERRTLRDKRTAMHFGGFLDRLKDSLETLNLAFDYACMFLKATTYKIVYFWKPQHIRLRATKSFQFPTNKAYEKLRALYPQQNQRSTIHLVPVIVSSSLVGEQQLTSMVMFPKLLHHMPHQ